MKLSSGVALYGATGLILLVILIRSRVKSKEIQKIYSRGSPAQRTKRHRSFGAARQISCEEPKSKDFPAERTGPINPHENGDQRQQPF